MKKARRTALALVTGAASIALVMSGCTPSGGGDAAQGPVSQDEIDEAMTTPTELTFWTWVPDIENEVKLFEEKYPAIDVTVENVGQGLPHYQKLRSAIEAGEGAPDVAQIEYQYIPSFVLPESLLDLTPYGADDLSGDYVDWAWNQVSPDERGLGDPAGRRPDGQPLSRGHPGAGRHHRAARHVGRVRDRREGREGCHGLVHLQPRRHAGRPDDRLLLAGGRQAVRLQRRGHGQHQRQQRRGQGGRVVLDRPDPAGPHLHRRRLQRHVVPGPGERQVRRLAHRGVGTDLPAGHGRGHVGLWRAAPLPQWEEGTEVSGNWGGSSDAVLASSENPIAAYELAKFINNDQESAMQARDRAVPLPAAGLRAGGPRVRRPGSPSSTAARRSTSSSPRSRPPSTRTSSGCRSWTTCTPPTRRRWAR